MNVASMRIGTMNYSPVEVCVVRTPGTNASDPTTTSNPIMAINFIFVWNKYPNVMRK